MVVIPPERSAERSCGWGQTLVLTLAAGALIALLNIRAFSAYFFAETFVYLGSYLSHGASVWGAIFSPHGHYFFRPTLWALNLPWNLMLPADPLAYHVRNFALVTVTVLLLHRVLLRLVRSPAAIAVAVVYFAVSKVHFTTIGYVATFSTILLLMLTLLSMLCLLRFIETRRPLDHALTLLFTALCIGSKDYGAGVLLVLAAIGFWRADAFADRGRVLLAWVAPVAVILAVYLALRLAIVPVAPTQGPYVPSVTSAAVGVKARLVLPTLANLSLSESHVSGAPGIARWTGPGAPALEWVLLGGFLVLLTASALAARPAGHLVLVPVVWFVAFTAPTLSTANVQIYYCNDAVAATALFMAICLDRLGGRWRLGWSFVVLLLGLNTAVSNAHSLYTWQWIAEKTEPLKRVAAHFERERYDRVVFVAHDRPLWGFALRANGLGPMVPVLFGNLRLQVHVLRPEELATVTGDLTRTLFLDPENGFQPFPHPALSHPPVERVSPGRGPEQTSAGP